MQAPQWTEFLQCPICLQAFSETVRLPISLACGHTACKSCLHSLQRKQCQFCSSPIHTDIDKLPVNDAILQLTGVSINRLTTQELDALGPDERALNATKVAIENLALLLKPLGGTPTTSTGSNHGGGGGATGVTGSTSGGGGGSGATSQLSRPMQRKLVTLINCQLVEPEGRARALRAARSLGERTVTELLLQHQNQQQLSSNLWAAVRQRGCQFLGPALQEECLRLILLALKDGEQLARKTLVMFVVQKLQEKQYQQASKTSVGHVVQLLYRASCFKVTKRDDDSSLMELKEEFRTIESLRREHDAQIVQIAMEAGLRIAPDQWSSLLYGDTAHKSHMQSIIDKLQTNDSFSHSIDELVIALTRSGDPHHLGDLRQNFEFLSQISPSVDSPVTDWEKTTKAMEAAEAVVNGLVKFTQARQNNKTHDFSQPFNNRYKTSMCKDMQQKGACPRGPSCTFAHSEEEMERYRYMRRGQASQRKSAPPQMAPPPGSFQAAPGSIPVHMQPSQFGTYHSQPPPPHVQPPPQQHPYYAPGPPQPIPSFYDRPLIRPMSQGYHPIPPHQNASSYASLPTPKASFQMASSHSQDNGRFNSLPANGTPTGSSFKDQYPNSGQQQSFVPRQQHHHEYPTTAGYGGADGFSNQQNSMPPFQREAENGPLLIGRGAGSTLIVHPTPNPYDSTMGGEYESTDKSSGFPSGRFSDAGTYPPYFEQPNFPSSGLENDFPGDYSAMSDGGGGGGGGEQRVRKAGVFVHPRYQEEYRTDMYGSQSIPSRRPRWSSGGFQTQSAYHSYGRGYPAAEGAEYDASGYEGSFGGGGGGGAHSGRRGLYDRKWSTGVLDGGNKRNRYALQPSMGPPAPFNTTTFGSLASKEKESYSVHPNEKEEDEEVAAASATAVANDEIFSKPFNGNVHHSPFSAAVGTPPSSKSPESKDVRKVSGVDGAGSLFGSNVTDADLAAVWENESSGNVTVSSTAPSSSSPATVASSSALHPSPWSVSSSGQQSSSWKSDGWPVAVSTSVQPANQDEIEQKRAELKRLENELKMREALLKQREEEEKKRRQVSAERENEEMARMIQRELHEEDVAINMASKFQRMRINESGGGGDSSGNEQQSTSPPARGTSDFDEALNHLVTAGKSA